MKFFPRLTVASGCAFLVALALTTAAPALPPLAIEPVRPYQPGDTIWTTPPPVVDLGGSGIESTGCTRVPQTGYIGYGVYARTSAKYSIQWNWSASSSNGPFRMYIFDTNDILYWTEFSYGAGNYHRLDGFRNYYWKVQNQDHYHAQAWNVCWYDY